MSDKDPGAICGGVISQSQYEYDVAKWGVWADAMAYVMPDEWFEQYRVLKEAGNDKEATKLFDKYAQAQV